MREYHYVEIQTTTRTFTVTAKDRITADAGAKSLGGAHSFSEYKEHPLCRNLVSMSDVRKGTDT